MPHAACRMPHAACRAQLTVHCGRRVHSICPSNCVARQPHEALRTLLRVPVHTAPDTQSRLSVRLLNRSFAVQPIDGGQPLGDDGRSLSARDRSVPPDAAVRGRDVRCRRPQHIGRPVRRRWALFVPGVAAPLVICSRSSAAMTSYGPRAPRRSHRRGMMPAIVVAARRSALSTHAA